MFSPHGSINSWCLFLSANLTQYVYTIATAAVNGKDEPDNNSSANAASAQDTTTVNTYPQKTFDSGAVVVAPTAGGQVKNVVVNRPVQNPGSQSSSSSSQNSSSNQSSTSTTTKPAYEIYISPDPGYKVKSVTLKKSTDAATATGTQAVFEGGRYVVKEYNIPDIVSTTAQTSTTPATQTVVNIDVKFEYIAAEQLKLDSALTSGGMTNNAYKILQEVEGRQQLVGTVKVEKDNTTRPVNTASGAVTGSGR